MEKGEGEGKRCCGVRTRSGGRAASFLLGGEYWFDDGGYLQGRCVLIIVVIVVVFRLK